MVSPDKHSRYVTLLSNLCRLYAASWWPQPQDLLETLATKLETLYARLIEDDKNGEASTNGAAGSKAPDTAVKNETKSSETATNGASHSKAPKTEDKTDA